MIDDNYKNLNLLEKAFELLDDADTIFSFNGLLSPDSGWRKKYSKLLKKYNDNYISKNTLKMIDNSMKNLKKGIVSEPVDIEEIKQILKRLGND